MKLKRIASALVAAVMAVALSVPVLADRTETIPGQGEIGFGTERTISPTFEKVDSTDTILGGHDGLTAVDMQNIPGAVITVTFEEFPGVTATAYVQADKSWSVNLPTGVTLTAGDRIYATQQEAGKLESLRTVVIVDSGDPGVVVERTIAPTFRAVEATDTDLRGDNLIAAFDMRNIPGAAITLTFENNAAVTATATVDPYGNWQVAVPGGVTLVNGEKIWATQQVDGQDVSLRTQVTIGDGEDGKVEPDPDPTPTNPEMYLSLTIPARFSWTVTPTSYPNNPNISSAVYSITTSGVTVGGQQYDPKVEVSLSSFSLEDSVATNLASDLVLQFNGDFASVGQLQNGVSSPVVINEIQSNITGNHAGANDTLTFGFTGKYSGGLTSSQQTPQYAMVLNFRITDADGWYTL